MDKNITAALFPQSLCLTSYCCCLSMPDETLAHTLVPFLLLLLPCLLNPHKLPPVNDLSIN